MDVSLQQKGSAGRRRQRLQQRTLIEHRLLAELICEVVADPLPELRRKVGLLAVQVHLHHAFLSSERSVNRKGFERRLQLAAAGSDSRSHTLNSADAALKLSAISPIATML